MNSLIPVDISLLIDYEYDGVTRRIDESDDIVEVSYVKKGSRITVELDAREEITLKQANLSFSHNYKRKERIFVNGYQSWTDTREFYPNETLNDVRKRLPKALVQTYAFDGYGDALFHEYDRNVLHGYCMSYADDLFIGSLNADNAYLSIDHYTKHKLVVLDSGVKGYKFSGKFKVIDVTFDRDEYLSSFNAKPPKKLLGYTSWYLHYQNINEEKILTNLEAIEGDYDVFQIDDGYETYVGDWLDVDSAKFPNGLEPIVDAIHAKNLMAGIWLAPLVAEADSNVYKEHPDWFLEIKAGCNWSGFYGIDIYNNDAEAYVRESLRHYVKMGFDFFKLDFLYAVNLQSRSDRTRAQITKDAYDIICEELAGKTILGCGAIISSAAGRFDYMRIGPDVSLRFDDVWYMQYMHRERISTKVTIQNTIYRSFFDGVLFGNDPDVFLLRSNDIYLNKEQRRALLTINALFGSVLMTSDNIGEYDDEQKALLAEALKLRDATDKSYHRDGRYIAIRYKLGRVLHQLKYDTEKGILI